MTKKITKACPRCHDEVSTTKQIEVFFGFRLMNGKKVPQSNCRLCRSAKSKESRLFKKNNPTLQGIDLRTIKKGKKVKSTIPKDGKKLLKKKLKGLWMNLTKEQRSSYKRGHLDYVMSHTAETEKQVKITKKKFLKKSKKMSNFKKDLKTFQTATMNKPKKIKSKK